ncbi:MAG: Flavin-dependent thymidylate synthase [Firmicutes bacterium]|nr:Flavin-dependent thymidylate synthase [Bacillota bacterium]MBT9157862.1 Flavin-dependent thymidylate synthase [Bacillota bacterium]
MKVTLLEHTPSPDDLVAQAARLCYSALDIASLRERLEGEKARELVLKLLSLHHDSPLEHVSFTFGIEGVSRALSHQLVRHRLASYSQQSQRYVKSKDFDFVTPPSIAMNPNLAAVYREAMAQMRQAYALLLTTVPAEDARYVLPNACATKLVATFNARSLYNFFNLRCCNRAQWEIRALAWAMLELVEEKAPAVFSAAGPDCFSERGCGEGLMSCQAPPERKVTK